MHLTSVNRCLCNKKSLQFSTSRVFFLPLSTGEHRVPGTNVPQKVLNVLNTIYLVLKIILLTLLIFFLTLKTERKNLNFPQFELPASTILLGAQGFLG